MSRDSVLIIDNKKILFLLYIFRYRNLNPNIFNGERERERERGDSHKTCHVSSRTYDLFITKQNFLYLEITITHSLKTVFGSRKIFSRK